MNRRIVKRELIDDVLANARRGRGRKGEQRNVLEATPKRGELPIFRTEIVAPFGHAMRFVDHERRDAAAIVARRVSTPSKKPGCNKRSGARYSSL